MKIKKESGSKISLCDKCVINQNCADFDVGVIKCEAFCTSEDSLIYQLFIKGYNAGYDTGYIDASNELSLDDDDEDNNSDYNYLSDEAFEKEYDEALDKLKEDF